MEFRRGRPLGNTRNITLLLMALWSSAVLGSLGFDVLQNDRAVEELARAEARGVFNKDLVYRRWAASHGGVYVPVTEETPPNPYLAHVTERDTVSPSGRKLTLMNPAYMTRQVHELSTEQYGLRGHITSLTPLRPENAPLDWEAAALMAFEDGADEHSEIAFEDGQQFLRLMRPMLTEEGCLACHAQQGYQVGDVRGGVSVSVPMAPYLRITTDQKRTEFLGHGAFWLLGLIGLGVGGGVLHRRQRARLQAEQALVHSEALYQDLFDSAPVPYFIVGSDGRIQAANRASGEFTGHTVAALLEMSILDLHADSSRADARRTFDVAGEGTAVFNQEIVYRTASGVDAIGLLSVAPIEDPSGAIVRSRAVVLDISEHKKLEGQLHVAQRMEAVGRLAGGVAHDFNNLLTVIFSYAGFLEQEFVDRPDALDDLQAIQKAAQKAAQLTSQLLAFSSRHVQRLEVLDLAAVVEDLHKLLRRVLGEDIDLCVEASADVSLIRGDCSQLEQIVMNLAVNARDAMPGGGRLTIETANTTLDDQYTSTHADIVPGDYVMMCVTDDGEGMDADTRSRIFEPFFTTKETGKGTGLGLATVYGIVNQSRGHIWVYSEPGHGTTFKIYWPRVLDACAETPTAPAQTRDLRGTETLLLVEDEAEVREAARRTLAAAGYEVLEAADAAGALEICEQRGHTIELLLTDVVMPRMSGPELASAFSEICPGARVVFMSGYTDKAIAHHGILPADTLLLGKPFSADALLAMVRGALDEGDTASSSG